MWRVLWIHLCICEVLQVGFHMRQNPRNRVFTEKLLFNLGSFVLVLRLDLLLFKDWRRSLLLLFLLFMTGSQLLPQAGMEQIRLFIFSPDKLTLSPPAFLSSLLLLSKSFHNGFNIFLVFSGQQGDLQTGFIHENLFCFSRFQIVLRLFNPTRWPHKLAILGSAVLKWATDQPGRWRISSTNWKCLTMLTCSCWKSWKSLPQWIPTAARTTWTSFKLSSIVYIIMSLINVDMRWTSWPGKCLLKILWGWIWTNVMTR